MLAMTDHDWHVIIVALLVLLILIAIFRGWRP